MVRRVFRRRSPCAFRTPSESMFLDPLPLDPLSLGGSGMLCDLGYQVDLAICLVSCCLHSWYVYNLFQIMPSTATAGSDGSHRCCTIKSSWAGLALHLFLVYVAYSVSCGLAALPLVFCVPFALTAGAGNSPAGAVAEYMLTRFARITAELTVHGRRVSNKRRSAWMVWGGSRPPKIGTRQLSGRASSFADPRPSEPRGGAGSTPKLEHRSILKPPAMQALQLASATANRPTPPPAGGPLTSSAIRAFPVIGAMNQIYVADKLFQHSRSQKHAQLLTSVRSCYTHGGSICTWSQLIWC